MKLRMWRFHVNYLNCWVTYLLNFGPRNCEKSLSYHFGIRVIQRLLIESKDAEKYFGETLFFLCKHVLSSNITMAYKIKSLLKSILLAQRARKTFLAEGQSLSVELEVGPHSGPYLLVPFIME